MHAHCRWGRREKQKKKKKKKKRWTDGRTRSTEGEYMETRLEGGHLGVKKVYDTPELLPRAVRPVRGEQWSG